MLQTNLINFSFALALLLWLFQLLVVVVVVVIILFVAGSLYNFCHAVSLSSLTMPQLCRLFACLFAPDMHQGSTRQAGRHASSPPPSVIRTHIYPLTQSLTTHSLIQSVSDSLVRPVAHALICTFMRISLRLPRAFYNTFQCSLQGICWGIQP